MHLLWVNFLVRMEVFCPCCTFCGDISNWRWRLKAHNVLHIVSLEAYCCCRQNLHLEVKFCCSWTIDSWCRFQIQLLKVLHFAWWYFFRWRQSLEGHVITHEDAIFSHDEYQGWRFVMYCTWHPLQFLWKLHLSRDAFNWWWRLKIHKILEYLSV